ncbi:MAG: hypothetical protein Q4A01_11840, partial [Coriobacteriales bacterium]|nr:hypothetical protein [Coriobacteriales bacterium]
TFVNRGRVFRSRRTLFTRCAAYSCVNEKPVPCSINAHYEAFSTKRISGKLKVQDKGNDFFAAAWKNAEWLIHPEDRERIRLFLDRDRLISELENRRQLTEDYRMIVGDGRVQYTRMSVTYASNRSHFIICVENRDEDIRREKEHLAELTLANKMARRDELTHTKNKTAYREVEGGLHADLPDFPS